MSIGFFARLRIGQYQDFKKITISVKHKETVAAIGKCDTVKYWPEHNLIQLFNNNSDEPITTIYDVELVDTDTGYIHHFPTADIEMLVKNPSWLNGYYEYSLRIRSIL